MLQKFKLCLGSSSSASVFLSSMSSSSLKISSSLFSSSKSISFSYFLSFVAQCLIRKGNTYLWQKAEPL
jgi:hypothetical protein